jgi:hypothetical protein
MRMPWSAVQASESRAVWCRCTPGPCSVHPMHDACPLQVPLPTFYGKKRQVGAEVRRASLHFFSRHPLVMPPCSLLSYCVIGQGKNSKQGTATIRLRTLLQPGKRPTPGGFKAAGWSPQQHATSRLRASASPCVCISSDHSPFFQQLASEHATSDHSHLA